MESLTSLFNVAGNVGYWMAWGLTVTTTLGLGYVGIFKGPRQLKPENGTARVITARKWPKFWEKDKIIARDGPVMYIKWGASQPSDIPLETYRVPVERKGKDESLILKDRVKARVHAEFFVRVDSLNNQRIVQAMEAFSGEIDERKIVDYCTPKFDAALREAAAELDVEQIQTDRDQFRAAVSAGLKSLENDGLVLIDVSLRQLDEAPAEDFDLTNYYDAEGYKKVIETTEAARIAINDRTEQANTAIAVRSKDEAVRRYQIQKEERQAELTKDEEIAELEAKNREAVAEHDANSRKKAEAARILADQEVELSEVKKTRAVKIAREEEKQATEEARINTSQAVALAAADEKIILFQKDMEESAASKAASEKRAEAVAAEEGVETARAVEQINRAKQVALIEADTIKQADIIAAQGKKEQDILAAEAVYAQISQEMAATAEGKAKLAEAVNALNPEAMQHLVEMARIDITPEAIEKAMAGVEHVDDMRVVSLNGGLGGAGAPFGRASDGNQPFLPGMAPSGNSLAEQIVGTVAGLKMIEPALNQISSLSGGDASIGKHIPGSATQLAERAEKSVIPVNDDHQTEGPARDTGAVPTPG